MSRRLVVTSAVVSTALFGVAAAAGITRMQDQAAAASTGPSVSTPPQAPLDSRLAYVNESTVPGLQRDRLEVATRLAELGPGGARAGEAVHEGAGISGIAVVANGVEVALTTDAALEATEAVIQREIASITAQSPGLAGFGNVTYAVEDLTVTQQSTSGGWKVWK